MDIMLGGGGETSRKNLQSLYFLLFYEIKKGDEGRASCDLQYQQISEKQNTFKSEIIRLIRGNRNSCVLECQLATPVLVKTVHTRATFVNQAISGGKGKGIKIPRRACLWLEVCVRFIVAEKIKISQH